MVPATPVSISATVQSTERHVGDQLNTSDFTVTVTMSDGSTVNNPSGWTANPMTLASESNVITISYSGLTTSVTVPATMASISAPPLSPGPQPVTGLPVRPTSESQFFDWAVANYGWSYNARFINGDYFYTIRKGNYEVILVVFGPGDYDASVHIPGTDQFLYYGQYLSDLTELCNYIMTL